MDIRRSRLTPALVLGCVALLAALGGTAYAASRYDNPAHQTRLGWDAPSLGLPAGHFTTSHGVQFLSAGQTVILGHAGPFTFSSTCSTDGTGQNQVTFDVTASTVADLDGNGPMPAGTRVNIHTDSDALDSASPGAFAQVGSASSSTEIAASGQEVDIFYTDGVNFQALGVSHDCFAGYTGFIG